MVGLARIAVSEVYDSAADEAVFSEHMVHDDVIFMRIYADGICRDRGANYLLNIGPDYLGRIPSVACDILRDAGRLWERENL